MLALALILVAPLVAAAQGNAVSGVPARVTDRVDVSRLVTLKGNTHPLARAQYDQGTAPGDLPMNRIMLVLQRSPEQEAALQELLTQQQVSSSLNFHKWLTPDQFGQQFGPTDADIQAVTFWLASFGFQNIQVSKGRVTIEFSGTASQVETALHTPIHRYAVNGESHWANANDPQIPTALAPVVAGFVSLHNFRPRPTIKTTGRRFPVKVKPGENPQIDLGNGSTHALVPADFRKIYNIGSSMTGAGATIGIVSDTNINLQDISDFRSQFGAPTNLPSIVVDGVDPGNLGGGPEGEAVLDATWASSVAPGATVDLVVSEDTNAAQGTDLSEVFIINNNLADVMTESFSACESGFGTALQSAAQFYGSVAEQAAAQGITFLVSSGDGGPDTCDDPSTEPAATPASVNLLAATPFNVAVGGTMFNDTSNPSTYWSASNGLNGESALSYIPEVVWNESCTTTQFNASQCPAVGLWSSGGGQSAAFTKPVWQTGVTGIPATNARFLPDVSLNAADHDGYVLCIDGSCHGTGCPNGVSVCYGIASGTSASVQVFGGIMALVVQKMGGSPNGRVGNANYTLYKLAGLETYSGCNASSSIPPGTCVFNDVTSGNTNVPGESGFAAGVGYDETTGLGSVNVTNLVNQWNTAVTKASMTTFALNGATSTVTITHGAFVAVGSVVSASPTAVAPAPTGDISLVANAANVAGTSSGQGVDFFSLATGGNTGVVNQSLNGTILLPGGSYPVHAHYSGDGTYLGSDSAAINVTVTPEGSRTVAGLIVANGSGGCVSPSTVAWGSGYVLGVVVSDLGVVPTPCFPNETGASPTGTVTLTDSFNGGAAQPLDGGSFQLNSGGWFEDQTIQLAVGTHKITATYLGDNSFSPSSTGASAPATFTITVTQGVSITPCSGAMITVTAPGQPGTCAITVSGPTGFSGTVTLSAAVTGAPSGAVNPPSCNSFSASNTITLTTSAESGSATMTCSTIAASGVMVRPFSREPEGRWPFGGIAVAGAGLLFLVAIRQKRRWSLVPLTALLVVVVLSGVSCGSSSSGTGSGSHPGTTAGTYTITVTATPNSGTAQTTIVTVVVQ